MIDVEWKGYKEWVQAEKQWAEEVIQMTLEEIKKTALRIERDSKLLVPVDTGDLRKSIMTDIKQSNNLIHAEVGTDIEYSEHVEFGTINQRAQPYLIPSFDRNVEGLERAIMNILRG